MSPDLVQAISAGATVVTPNRRLALSLRRDFDDVQTARGLTAWDTADILPLSAFIERSYEDALYSDVAASVPLLLAPAQESQLWEAVIQASEWGGILLAPAQTAAQCREAWQLAHEWRIAGALGAWQGNEDTQAFAAWASAYSRRCQREGHTDAARLPDVVIGLLPQRAFRVPKLLVAHAFDILTAQQQDFLDACAKSGIPVQTSTPVRRGATPVRLAFAGTRDELERAAQWARARLEANTSARIGIVVPDLDQRRSEVERVFGRLLQPDWNLPGAVQRPPSFNVSLGMPLVEYPLSHAALAILELAQGEAEFALVSRLIRSPFLNGADSEAAHRARLDIALRKQASPRLTLPKLLGLIETTTAGCVLLAQQMGALFVYARQHLFGSHSPQDWARHFSALLEIAGFPGERALDSNEYQTRAKLHDTFGEFARVEHVLKKITYKQALIIFRRLCTETLFQPESGDAPIQILGIFEAAGLEFDHLWVSGLTDEAWPLAVRPNPFIPLALQKKAGVPQAAIDSSFALDKRLTAGWLAAADEVLVSHPMREQDRDLAMSPLIASVAASTWGALGVPDYPRYRDVIHRARLIESTADTRAPAMTATAVRGGVRVLADQAACPFRAFARHRLAAQPMETPTPGLGAADRGTLMHVLLKSIWDKLQNSSTLGSIDAAKLAEIIDSAAAVAIAEVGRKCPGILEGRFAQLEHQRLTGLARAWLEVEKQRPDFEVVVSEDSREFEVAGLSLKGRIDRLDRLADGSHALIDYKTGKTAVSAWMGERPDDPQLPLYAINAKENIAAIAFAKVKVGEMKFEGLARTEPCIPGATTLGKSRLKLAKNYASWNDLVAGWKRELAALGLEFASGDARVAPKYLAKTCEFCDLQPLCRVHERIAMSSLDGEDGETAE